MTAAVRLPVISGKGRAFQAAAREAYSKLESWLSSEAVNMSLDEVEREQEERGREIQRLLLQAHLESRGTGDVGPAIEVVRRNEEGEQVGAPHRHGQRREHVRGICSIFGDVDARRTAYHAPGTESIHPFDEKAALPDRSFSYELQRRAILGAIQGTFDEATARVAESTGVRLSKRSVEDLVRETSVDFEAFYTGWEPPPPSETGPILVAAVDCKGVPMVKPEQALRTVRRGKGEKANKKRMATVAAVFTQHPRPRTPEEVVESLFYEGPRLVKRPNEKRLAPEYKRVWASLEKSKEDVIQEVADEVLARDPKRRKKRVVLSDGERSLQLRLGRKVPKATAILDLLHVTEKLWKAVYCFCEEGSEEAKEWVRERTLRILRGEVSQVIKGMRQSATKRGLEGEARETIDSVTGYFYRNRHRMRYHEYLRDGLPIASGSVEGACKNLVKDRMERSGMRWTMATGEALLKLRAVYLSGDFGNYWSFHMAQEQRRLHPEGRWKVVEK